MFAIRESDWYCFGYQSIDREQEPVMPRSETISRPVDLHLHSTCSDGLSTPSELVAMAREAGFSAIALCDHDSVAGINDALAAGSTYEVEVLAGIELSSTWQTFQDIHLLGYGIDHCSPQLLRELSTFRSCRRERNRKILDRINGRLQRDRKPLLDFYEIQAAVGDTVGRPHLARALVAKGYARNIEDAFQRYLIPCNIPKRYFPMDQAIRLVHDAGGIAVLAHPLLVTRILDRWEALLDGLTAIGLDGIEVYTPSATEAEIDFFLRQARHRGLTVTGGSDYHGPPDTASVPGTGFGSFSAPHTCLTEVRAALLKQNRF